MIFWLIIGGMMMAVLICLLVPLFRQQRATATRESSEIAVYRHQLSQLGQEVERGLLSDEEAEAMKVEISRRMLAAEGVPGSTAHKQLDERYSAILATLLVAMVPVAAISIYMNIGSPNYFGGPAVSRQAAQTSAEQSRHSSMEASIERLTERLEQDPTNVDGWILLARTYSALQRFDDAAAAYRRAVDRSGGRIDLVGDLGETLIKGSGGIVTDDVRTLFETVQAAAPKDPRARYFLGLARAQAGKGQEAIDMWLALAAEFPPDAPWQRSLRQLMEQTATRYGIDLPAAKGGTRASAPEQPGPTPEDVARAGSLAPDERQDMIRGMVARLASRLEEEPDDIDGWIKLVRSYVVLGDADAARTALKKAADAAAGKPPAIRSRLEEAARQLGLALEDTHPAPGATEKTSDPAR